MAGLCRRQCFECRILTSTVVTLPYLPQCFTALYNFQCAWEKLAWPSKKNLLSEFMDMLRRIAQLGSWSEDLVTPQCVWLPGLFNPTAYLTAVMQVRSLSYSKTKIYGWEKYTSATKAKTRSRHPPDQIFSIFHVAW